MLRNTDTTRMTPDMRTTMHFAFYSMGLALIDEGQPAAAIEMWSQSTLLLANLPHVWLQLSCALRENPRWARAAYRLWAFLPDETASTIWSKKPSEGARVVGTRGGRRTTAARAFSPALYSRLQARPRTLPRCLLPSLLPTTSSAPIPVSVLLRFAAAGALRSRDRLAVQSVPPCVCCASRVRARLSYSVQLAVNTRSAGVQSVQHKRDMWRQCKSVCAAKHRQRMHPRTTHARTTHAPHFSC